VGEALRRLGDRQLDRPLAAALAAGLVGFMLLPSALSPLLAVAALAIGSTRPRFALLAVVSLLPLYRLGRPLAGLEVPPHELMLAATLAGTLWRLLPFAPDRRAALRWPRTGFDPPIVLFMCSALLSLLVTEYWRLSLRELRTLILEPTLTYYLLLLWFPEAPLIRPLAGFLLSAVVVAAVGLVAAPFGWGTSAAEGVQRLQASYSSANHLGLFLGRALPFLVALGWLAGRWRWPVLAGATIVSAALAATFSLGAWLGSAAALAMGVGRLGGPRRLLALAAGLAALFALSLAVVPTDRLSARLDPSQGTTFFRLKLWESSLAMVADHPLLGIGLDNFLYRYQQSYIQPEALAEANLSHPHNLVLHFWLQLGVLGLVAALWLLANGLRQAWRQSGPTGTGANRTLAAGALGSLTNFLVHGQIDNSYFLPDLAIVFWLTLACLERGRAQEDVEAGAEAAREIKAPDGYNADPASRRPSISDRFSRTPRAAC
jgi:O-antigen ligase